jgi:hypothetical protein
MFMKARLIYHTHTGRAPTARGGEGRRGAAWWRRRMRRRRQWGGARKAGESGRKRLTLSHSRTTTSTHTDEATESSVAGSPNGNNLCYHSWLSTRLEHFHPSPPHPLLAASPPPRPRHPSTSTANPNSTDASHPPRPATPPHARTFSFKRMEKVVELLCKKEH